MNKKAVLISIRPEWCNLIASGRKTVEIRKNSPKLTPPFKCYIYCTNPNTKNPHELLEIHSEDGKIRKANGKVMGEFVCDKIFPVKVFDCGSIQNYYFYDMENSLLSMNELGNYIGYGKTGYGWHISNLVIYDKPKELDWFRKPIECHKEDCKGCWDCEIKRPPQSWCYVEA